MLTNSRADASKGKMRKQIYRCLDGYQTLQVEGESYGKGLSVVINEIEDLISYVRRCERVAILEDVLHDLEPSKQDPSVAVMSISWYNQHSKDLKLRKAYKEQHDKDRDKEMEIKTYGNTI